MPRNGPVQWKLAHFINFLKIPQFSEFLSQATNLAGNLKFQFFPNPKQKSKGFNAADLLFK